jgi:hypothetical protein
MIDEKTSGDSTQIVQERGMRRLHPLMIEASQTTPQRANPCVKYTVMKNFDSLLPLQHRNFVTGNRNFEEAVGFP